MFYMTGVTFSDNHAYSGSAIHIGESIKLSSDSYIELSRFSGNSTDKRGTIYVEYGRGTLEIRQVTFTNNTGRGSAIFNHIR